jgi:hypothetical protein
MYERFTDRARRIMRLANQEALRLNDLYLDTEHILLGLVREGASVAANVLANLDVDLPRLQAEIERVMNWANVVRVTNEPTRSSVPPHPCARKVIEYAIEEAHRLHHDYVGSEHLLLGLLRTEAGFAALVLENLGVSLASVREEMVRLLGPPTGPRIAERFPDGVIEDLPADVRRSVAELDVHIDRLDAEKEAAVEEEQFYRAAILRDQADELKMRKKAVLADWAVNHPIDRSWLAWNGGWVARIATEIYEESRWEELPVLGDALEEAGCTDQEMLGHCRQPGEHTRRCWVVELLLGNL